MRIPRFFSERTNIREGSSVKLDDKDIAHIRNALRLKKEDRIIIFNGEKEFMAHLNIVRKDVVTAKVDYILKDEKNSAEEKLQVAIFFGLLKAGKIDDTLKPLTELGIDVVVPVECEYSQSKIDALSQSKLGRWSNIVVAAAKQCERIDVPEVMQPITFEEALSFAKEFDQNFFLTFPRKNIAESMDVAVPSLKDNSKKIAYWVGPEGGFSPNEHKLAKEAGFEFVQISTQILRSETAAISFASIIQFLKMK